MPGGLNPESLVLTLWQESLKATAVVREGVRRRVQAMRIPEHCVGHQNFGERKAEWAAIGVGSFGLKKCRAFRSTQAKVRVEHAITTHSRFILDDKIADPDFLAGRQDGGVRISCSAARPYKYKHPTPTKSVVFSLLNHATALRNLNSSTLLLQYSTAHHG